MATPLDSLSMMDLGRRLAWLENRLSVLKLKGKSADELHPEACQAQVVLDAMQARIDRYKCSKPCRGRD